MSALFALLLSVTPQELEWRLIGLDEKEYGPVAFWCLPKKDQLHSIIAAQTKAKTAIDYNFGMVGTINKQPIFFDKVEFFLNEKRYRGSVMAKFRGTNSKGFMELVLTDNPTRERGGGRILGDFVLEQNGKKTSGTCGSNMPVPPRFLEKK